MDKKVTELYGRRLERFQSRVAAEVLGVSCPLHAEYAHSLEPVAIGDREQGSFHSIAIGEIWGKRWESAWFHLEGTVPAEWQGACVVAQLDFGGEGLVVSPHGDLIQGISNGSVFDADFNRDLVRLFDRCAGGEAVDLWVETAANSLFGVHTHPDPGLDTPQRYGQFEARVTAMSLRQFDDAAWALWLDLRILNGLVQTLPVDSVRRARIIEQANMAIDKSGEGPTNHQLCRKMLAPLLQSPANTSSLKVAAVGHAHIDTAWLWPVRETIRKCARTFASQLALIKRYPEYIFGASQAEHYLFVKEHYPNLYERIKQAVVDGRWEIQGGMWVEADCNLISGESMVRQILHGKNFFRDEFGVEVNNCWLPDVFGYSAAMPQLLRKAGIDFFLTQKISWNQFTEFPHHTFRWQGIDGSEVITHFPPENNYNSQLGSEFLCPAETNFKEKGFLDEFLSLFGVGDGGGGPKEENIELGRRLANLEGAPRVAFDSAQRFFDRLQGNAARLPTWAGELYLELHRGTLTSQAAIKRLNRKLEVSIRHVEMLWSSLPLAEYPVETLATIWRTVLRNQFHDIIPGSSITRVYEDTTQELQAAQTDCHTQVAAAAARLFERRHDSMVVVNATHYSIHGPMQLPEDWTDGLVRNQDEDVVPTQLEGESLFADVQIRPYSVCTLTREDGKSEEPTQADDLVLENELIRYEFSEHGRLVRCFDKERLREVVVPDQPGNMLTLYCDYPNDWDAWDVDLFYEQAIVENLRAETVERLPGGEVRESLACRYRVGSSELRQKIHLGRHSKRLDFVTEVDWSEKHRMLRVAFPVSVQTNFASYDIQYGHVRRPNHRNTLADLARFEVVGHKYADLSDADYGVALLNDCKYGYKVHGSVLDLNLLRSPNYPDPDADQGRHEFTYSLLPHTGDLVRSCVIAEASLLNSPPLTFDGCAAPAATLPCTLVGEGLELAVIKRAEKEDCLVIRIVETLGRCSSGKLSAKKQFTQLIETDLMEWNDGSAQPTAGGVPIELKPFEVATFKLC